ncbi:MAG: hypothetical protein HYY62_07230 [Deltaproteobacteria bacterium]|nr:hypothetical protein [Deltaproteobacteria bacterium]
MFAQLLQGPLLLAAPKILFKPDHSPLPLAPFPNNFFTTPDATSETGLRVQLPIQSQEKKMTAFEKRIREKTALLNGFGTFSPILIPFDSPLDLKTIGEESIVVVNLQKNSSHYGKRAALDFGSGLFEYQTERPTSYLPYDPLASSLDSFLFKAGNRKVFYDDETHPLIARPLTPLAEESRYGVILTKNLKGEDGESIQTDLVTSQDLLTELETLGFSPQNISYAWEFTTQSTTNLLKEARKALYGEGQWGQLGAQFPPVLREISDLKTWPFDIDLNRYVLTPTVLQKVLSLIARIATKVHLVEDFPIKDIINWDSVDYFVFGSYFSPQFNKNNFKLLEPSREPVYFMAAIPKKNRGKGPPFPVTIFGHGNKRARVDAIGLSNTLAQAGIATITIDAAGHGPDHFLAAIPVYIKRFFSLAQTQDEENFKAVKKDLTSLGDMVGVEVTDEDLSSESLIGKLIDKIFRRGILRVLTREGRATDIDQDGIPDSGEAFFTADFFSTREIVRQTILDFFQLTRVLKNLGIDQNGNGKIELLEGDFNFDGIPDLGGPTNPIYYVGLSMGGMIGSLLMATEPEIQTGVLNVGGGGLLDILLRTSSKYNAKRIFHQLWGPAVVGVPQNGRTYITFNGRETNDAFTIIESLEPGGAVFLRNKTKRTVFKTEINSERGFLTKLAADNGDQMELDVFHPYGTLIAHIEFPITYQEGLGYLRNTPEFRQMAFMGQWLVDPADPVNFAPQWKNKNVLMQLALGDWTVPVLSGIHLGRVGGLISPSRLQWLMDKKIHRGEIIKVDTEENPPESLKGSAIRFHPSGKHEYLIIPNLKDKEMMSYTAFSQAQVVRYLLSHGERID